MLLAAGLPACSSGTSAEGHGAVLAPAPGLPAYQAPGAIPVPGGVVNAAGGNLLVRRVDLAIDTQLGTREIGATYNSATRRWRWSFELRYDGTSFVDANGARHDVGWLDDGERIPGTLWVKLDDSRIRSLGGLVHAFHAGGRLAAIHWSSGAYPRLEYVDSFVAEKNRIAEIRQCTADSSCANVFSIAYDARGRVSAITDRAGRLADFAYGADGWLAVARDGLDTARSLPGTRYEYFPGQRLRALTNSEGERIEYVIRDGTSHVEQVRRIGAEGPRHRFEYGNDAPIGWPGDAVYWTRYWNPLGHDTLYRYDSVRRIYAVTLPSGETIDRNWKGYDVARLTLPGGVTTRWERAAADEVLRIDPSGNRVRIRFQLTDAENRDQPYRRPIEEIADDLGLVERRGYSDGRLAWIENGEAERTSLAYDIGNHIASITSPSGVSTSYAGYGEHGHATVVGFGGEFETRSFDAVGNPTGRSGADRTDLRPGGEVARAWDEDRNLASISLEDLPAEGSATSGAIALEYRSDGGPIQILRPGGGDHEFVYDALGRLVELRERVDGQWRATTYEVDALDRITAVELPNGMRREASFDEAGRRRSITALRNGSIEGSATFSYQDGRLAAVSDSLHPGAESYSYDGAGRLASIAFPAGETLEFAYDLRSRRTAEAYRLAEGTLLTQLAFGFDLADRETSLAEGALLLIGRLHLDGRLAQTSYGNGLVSSHTHDPTSGLLTGTTTSHPSQGLVASSSVALESIATPSELRLTAQTTSFGPAATLSYEEYALGPRDGAPGSPGKRLLGWDDGGGFRLHAFDLLGNLTTADSRALLYNAEGNRLLAIEDQASGTTLVDYQYDDAGYVTQRDGEALTWTALGRVASIGTHAVFEWDLQNRPLRRVLDGVETRFLFGGRVETDVAGVPERFDMGEVELRLASGEHRYRHFDFRGNAKLVSDDAGQIVTHVTYGPYGAEVVTGDADDAAGFAGGRAVGDLVLLGARVHDPQAGRFLSPDPIFQTVNQFTYTQANPVSFWDPGGTDWQAIGFYYGAFAAAGAAWGFGQGGLIGMAVGIALGLAAAEAGYQLANPGERMLSAEEVLKAIAPYLEPARSRSDQGPQSSAGPPGAMGFNGVSSLGLGLYGGPDLYMDLSPEPGCPCGDGLPGGGHLGANLSTGVGFGFGGFGGFGGF